MARLGGSQSAAGNASAHRASVGETSFPTSPIGVLEGSYARPVLSGTTSATGRPAIAAAICSPTNSLSVRTGSSARLTWRAVRRQIWNSRPRNGWLWPIDRAGHLVPFRQQPLQYAEFGVVPFGASTIHPPCVFPPRRVAPMNTLSITAFSFRRPTPDKRTHGQFSVVSQSQWHPGPIDHIVEAIAKLNPFVCFRGPRGARIRWRDDLW